MSGPKAPETDAENFGRMPRRANTKMESEKGSSLQLGQPQPPLCNTSVTSASRRRAAVSEPADSVEVLVSRVQALVRGVQQREAMRVWRTEQRQHYHHAGRAAGVISSSTGSTSVRGMGAGHTTVKQRGVTSTSLSHKASDSPVSGSQSPASWLQSKDKLLSRGGQPALRVDTASKVALGGASDELKMMVQQLGVVLDGAIEHSKGGAFGF